jgi:ABC-type antimicrobial peptide transport system permease subunit
MSAQSTEDTLIKGRGFGVTAITAILNLNDRPFDFIHSKYPHYNRQIPPGFFRYPFGTTAPINWGSDAGGLIQFGTLGSMWQHNIGDWSVRYKQGANPVNDGDGEIVYTRRPSVPGEHYLILGVKGNRVSTLKSYTPGEAFLENFQDAVLNAMNILKPSDYTVLAKNSGQVRKFTNRLKEADDAGLLNGLDRRDVDALLRINPRDLENQLNKLTPEDRRELEEGKGSSGAVTNVKKLFELFGIIIFGAASAITVIAGVISLILLFTGPAGWTVLGLVGGILAIVVGVLGIVGTAIALIVWILGFFENTESMALLEEPAL